jgi:phosphoserine aminotransferase
MIPMNFLNQGKQAGYVMTGSWSEKALKEAQRFGQVYEAASSAAQQYKYIPGLDDLHYQAEDAYLHITSNNTIFGTQWQEFPDTGTVPLIADMSSDILSRPLKVDQFAMIYAGAQKNLGPSGVTVAIVRKDLLETAHRDVPAMLCYDTHVKHNSLYNTPPTFGIYMLGLVLEWAQESGGAEAIASRNKQKAALIYEAIDRSGGFYIGHATEQSRSLMNITFRLADEQLEKQFLSEASEQGFIGLTGHRSVGGCRASTYNAVPYEACEALSDFMVRFQQTKG